MTTNVERAGKVIWDEQAAGLAKPRDLAQALADAGLLMPDPAELGDLNHRGEPVWVTDNRFALAATELGHVLRFPSGEGIRLSVHTMRQLIPIMTAAVEYSERGQGNG